MKSYLGIEIGGTKLQLAVGDENARITERFRFPVDLQAGAEGIRHHIAETLRQLRSQQLQAIGVGFGGPVDRNTGKVWTSHQVRGWSGFPLAEWLVGLAGVPVFVENDANVAALGEACHGAGKHHPTVFYVTLGSGVGAGLIIDRKIYHGEAPGEVEFGHIRLDKKGRTVEQSCSGWAVDEKVRQSAKAHPSGKLASLTKNMEGGEAGALRAALLDDDAEAQRIVSETMDDLSFGLSHAVHLFHPATIILGGGLSLTGEGLRQLAEHKLAFYLMEAFRPGPAIHLSALKEDTVTVGALTLAIHNA